MSNASDVEPYFSLYISYTYSYKGRDKVYELRSKFIQNNI